MKNLILVSLTIASSAFAESHVLKGADAVEMVNILKSSGIGGISDVTLEFVSAQNLNCIGIGFNDQCEATFADARPAASPKSITPSMAGKFWSLLIKAGFKNRLSDVADGSAGKYLISASRVDCELQSQDESLGECTLE